MTENALAIAVLACSTAFAPGVSAREAVVTGEDVTLRASCGAAGSVLARLPPGHKVKFRFAISGATSECYSVTAEVGGKVLKGYVPKTAVSGLHEFERTRPQASSGQIVSRAMAAARLPAPAAAGSPRRNEAGRTSEQQQLLAQAIAEIQEGKLAEAERLLASYPALAQDQAAALLRSQALLRLSRPRDALNVADAALRNHGQDAGLLAAAGLAAYRLDDVRRAEYLLKLSLSIKHNSTIASIQPAARRALEQLGKDRALPKLEALSNGWSRYSRGQALVAYGLSLAAMEVFFEHYQSYGLRNLMRDPQQLPRLTEELDHWLEQRYQ